MTAPLWRWSGLRSQPSISTASHARSRWLIALLGLFALAIQSFVVQTHVHIPATSLVAGSLHSAGIATDPATKAATHGPENSPHDRFPLDGDPSNCPLCQELMQAGHFIAPVGISFSFLFVVITMVAILNDTVRVSAISHYWRGRGPPRIWHPDMAA